jgi:hypothetical protein
LLLEAGLSQPAFVNGVQQKPIEGVSMLYSFNDAAIGEDAEEADHLVSADEAIRIAMARQ